MDSVALFLCIVRYFVGEEILLERTSFVYSFIVVIKQKTRPGSLFYGKRGGFCCCKYREYILNYKTFFKKNFAYISSSIQNDTLFAIKRYVVCNKTIRCFQQNDTLFAIKRHVVFSKTTRCFQQNDTLFFESFALPRYKHRLASRALEINLTTLRQGDENELFRKRKKRESEVKERQKPYERENNYVLTTKFLCSKNLSLYFYNNSFMLSQREQQRRF